MSVTPPPDLVCRSSPPAAVGDGVVENKALLVGTRSEFGVVVDGRPPDVQVPPLPRGDPDEGQRIPVRVLPRRPKTRFSVRLWDVARAF